MSAIGAASQALLQEGRPAAERLAAAALECAEQAIAGAAYTGPGADPGA